MERMTDDEDRTTTVYRIPVRYWIDQCRAELAAARERTNPKETP